MRSHYIPQAYFKGFTDSNDRVWTYDLLGGNCFIAARTKVGVEKNLYSEVTEARLAKEIEERNLPILDKIISQHFITADEKQTFCSYIANMCVRVPENKNVIAKLIPNVINATLWDLARHHTYVSGQNLAQLEPIMRETRLRLESFDQVKLMFEHLAQPERLNLFKSVLNKMRWQFLTSLDRPSFVTSDNPVFFPRNMGIRHSEVIFPLSTTVVLWANWDSTHKGQFMPINKSAVDWINNRIIGTANRFIYFSRKVEWIDELVKNRRSEVKQDNSELE